MRGRVEHCAYNIRIITKHDIEKDRHVSVTLTLNIQSEASYEYSFDSVIFLCVW